MVLKLLYNYGLEVGTDADIYYSRVDSKVNYNVTNGI